MNEPALQRDAFFRRFPFLDGRRVILFLSRLHRKKGCDLLVRAFASIAATDSRLQLVISGPDEEGLWPTLKRLAAASGVAERITWTGSLEGDSKWGAFRAAEAFALPSHTENYGVAVVEALACGTPVLITNKVNIWREIAEDKAGFVADDNIEGVAGLLNSWITLSEEQKEVLRGNAQSCFRRRFELEPFAERFLTHVELAVGKLQAQSRT